ncbi:MAG: sigma-70 family RNA polymerase sigma factor [Planctomycetota bacterium]
MQPSLESLFARYRNTGQPEPLGELFDRASPQLLALALHLTGHPADAEDALQATFVAAIDGAGRWQAQRPLLPWLCGILDKQCRRIRQRSVRRREQELPDEVIGLDDGSPLAASERRDLVARLREHIDRLPVEQRQVLLLQLEHGLAPAEAAEVLGVPPGTVRMRLHRGVQALRGVLPAGLTALLVAALPSRGVAAVRAAVVGHALVTGAVLGGGVLMAKKLMAVVVVVVLVAGGVLVTPRVVRIGDSDPATPATPVASALVTNPTIVARSAEEPTTASRIAAGAAMSPGAPTSPMGALLVRVVHARTRAPLANMPVRLMRIGGDVEPRFSTVVGATGRDGCWLASELAPGHLRIVLQSDNEPERNEALIREGVTTTVEVESPVGTHLTNLRGHVRHADGRAAGGASIVAGWDSREVVPIGVADAAGGFAVDVPTSQLLIGARLEGFAPSRLQDSWWDSRFDLELVLLGEQAIVDGKVHGPDALPIEGACVEIGEARLGHSHELDRHRSFPPPPRRLRSGPDGAFTVSGLPAGEVSVVVRADGHAPFDRYVTLVAGTRTGLDCALVPGEALHGRVVDQAGVPVASASVSLGGSYGEPRTTDAEGRFGYRHVAASRQAVRVEAEDCVTRYVERPAEATGEWCIELQRGQRHALRFVDEEAQPLAEWQVQLESVAKRTGLTDGDGRVALVALGTGPFRLWIAAPGVLQAVQPIAWPDAVPGVESTIVVPKALQPTGVVRGVLVDADGEPWLRGFVSLRAPSGRFCFLEPLRDGNRFVLGPVPPGDWSLSIQRDQVGCALLRLPISTLARGEVRDLGLMRLPREGRIRVRVVRPGGSDATTANVFLRDEQGGESNVPPCAAQAHVMPLGRYRWRVTDDEGLWQSGSVEIHADGETALDVVLQPGVQRYVAFPSPRPDWGTPRRVGFVLRAPDGSSYDAGAFNPAAEMPYRQMPTLCPGTWSVELQLDDGRRFGGTFSVASLAPSRELIEVAVVPAR